MYGYKVSGQAFKHGDTTRKITFSFVELGNRKPFTPNPEHKYFCKVGNDTGYLRDVPVAVSGSDFYVKTSDLTRFSPGDDYVIEVWEAYKDDEGDTQTRIWPTPNARVPFVINENIEDRTGTNQKMGISDAMAALSNVRPFTINLDKGAAFDLNQLEKSGVFFLAPLEGASQAKHHVPVDGKWWYVLSLYTDFQNSFQLAIPSDTSVIYMRTMTGSQWNQWNKFFFWGGS